MQIVLLTRIEGVGNRGDIVEVSDGYARNNLIPQGKAERATAGVAAQAERMRQAWQVKNTAEREAAEEIAKRLVTAPISITARASGEGKLFGSVSAGDVVDAVQAATGVELDRKMVSLGDGIKTVGSHMVTVQPHPEVQFPINVEVASA